MFNCEIHASSFFLQLNDYVGGLAEVHGQVDGQNNILCNNYIVFPKEASDSFGTYVNYYIWLSNYATILWYWSAVTIFVFPSVDMMSFVNILPGVNKSPSPGLVIPTFGLAEIISCMPDGLVKIYIGY